jgi:hypothetical protein
MAYGDVTPVWSEAQLLTASQILHQVRWHKGTDAACVIALSVALVESLCLCLSSDKVPASKTSPYVQGNAPGDHLSVGPFQQQPWWGPTAELMNPYGATQRFLTGGDDGSAGLYSITGWEDLGPGVAATRVQRNATGSSPYAARLPDARHLCSLLSSR